MCSNKPDQSSESLSELISHSRWVVEYLSAANNNLLTRSATLMGLLGVEIAFVATWDPSQFATFHLYKLFIILGVGSAIGGTFLLVVAGRVKNFVFPNFSQIDEALTYQPLRATKEILEIMLHKQRDPIPSLADRLRDHHEKKDLYDRLVRENNQIRWCFRMGTNLALLSQIFFGLLLVMRWVHF
jgi:hypothetical protein